MRKDNTSGYTGVWQNRRNGTWVFTVASDYGRVTKYGFPTAREAWQAKLAYIKRHGTDVPRPRLTYSRRETEEG